VVSRRFQVDSGGIRWIISTFFETNVTM